MRLSLNDVVNLKIKTSINTQVLICLTNDTSTDMQIFTYLDAIPPVYPANINDQVFSPDFQQLQHV